VAVSDEYNEIRARYDEIIRVPMNEFVPRSSINYVAVANQDNDQIETSVTTTTGSSSGDGTWITIPDLTAPMPEPNHIRYTRYAPTWSGHSIVVGPPSPQAPFTISDEAMERLRRIVAPQPVQPVVPAPAESLSEMIKAVHFYPGGQCVILVNGPKINGGDTSDPMKQQLSPEQIKRLDRELKAAIIRAFDLVIDARKLPEFKRTLIVD